MTSSRDPQVLLPPDQTHDLLSGGFKIFQYKKGHRFSTDDLLVAWYGLSNTASANAVLDLGSGVGTVGMIAAACLPEARLVTVEAQSISVALARKSAEWNQISHRYEIREGDFRDKAVFHPNEKFDLVFGSPPYFPLGAGLHGDTDQKIACRFEVRGSILDYCRVAASVLSPGGRFAVVFPVDPVQQRERVQEGAREAGLSIVRSRDVILKEGSSPLLGLFLMQLREGNEESLVEPPLTIRRQDGSVHPEYTAAKLSIGFPL